MKYKTTSAGLLIIFIAAISLLLSNCATLNLDLKSMKPKDYVTVAMGVYVQQFERHQNRASNPNITDKERKDLQKLKSDLIKLHDALDLANLALSAGNNPTPETMQMIMSFLEEYYYK